MTTKKSTPKKKSVRKTAGESALDGAACSPDVSDTPETDGIASQFRAGKIHSDFLLLSLAQMERERDQLHRWTSVNGVWDLVRERDEAHKNAEYWKRESENLRTEMHEDAKMIVAAELQRDAAIRVLRVLKSDIDHIGHWLPDPCRKMVESFLLENVQSPPTGGKEA